jgi:dipeptidyl-peptidase-3
MAVTEVNTPEGLRALEFYDPAAKKHGQAHMQARLGITRWLIKEGIARLEEIRASDGTLENLYIRVSLLKLVCIRIATYCATPA